MNESRNVFVDVMMIDAAETCCLLAAGTNDAISMHDAPDALAEYETALRASHADFHVIDRVAHDLCPCSDPMLREGD